MSLYVSASSLGMFVGPPAPGALVDPAGFAKMFRAEGGLLAAGTVAFVYAERPHHLKVNGPQDADSWAAKPRQGTHRA